MDTEINVKRSMKRYFERLLEAWQQSCSSLPQIPINEEADRDFYVEIDADGELALWRPLEMITSSAELLNVESVLGVSLHPSIAEYFSSYWFAAIGGTALEWRIQLEPVLPGIGVREFVQKLDGYKCVHNDRLDHIPIGTEANGSLVVVRNSNGTVELEDWDARSYTRIANSLDDLIELMHP